MNVEITNTLTTGNRQLFTPVYAMKVTPGPHTVDDVLVLCRNVDGSDAYLSIKSIVTFIEFDIARKANMLPQKEV